jgi:sugar lactone lactonase YvrE
VLERDAHRVRRLTADGTTVRTWGGRGSGDGELLFPQGLGLAPDGCVWVADTGNRRVVRFSGDGEFLSSFDGSGTEQGPFLRPVDVAIRAGRVAVADTGHHGVLRFNDELEPLFMLGGHGTEECRLMSPSGVAYDHQGNLVVADTENHRVRVYDREGVLVTGWGDWGWYPGLFSTPVSVAVRDGLVFVADQENHRVQVFDGKGELVHRWGLHALKPGQGEGHLHYPSAVAISCDGSYAAVAEPLDDRVQIFRRARSGDAPPPKVPDWRANSASAHFGTQLAAGGNLLAVIEPETHSLLIYEDTWLEPRQVTILGGFGSPWGQFRRPAGIDWDPATSTLTVSDRGNRRLQLFRICDVDRVSPDYDPRLGRFLTGVDLEQLDEMMSRGSHTSGKSRDRVLEPGPILRNREGDLILLDPVVRNLLFFNSKLELLGQLRTSLRDPRDLAMAGDGETILATDAAIPGVVALGRENPGTLLVGPGGGVRTGLIEPHGICVDGKGRIWVVDTGAHALFRFRADGTPDGRWGRRGIGRMEFNKPRGVTLDGQGRLVVVDHGNHRLMTVSDEGEYVGVFGPRLYTYAARYPDAKPANGADR